MYIGQSPSIGNFQVCDAISTVNGQATYNLTVNSVAVTPETANHVLCSVNGILQKPGSSFTIVNSTIVFSANLVTGDVVDFVHILGSVLDLGVPSDDTVTAAKISSNAVTGAKLNTDVISAQTALATAPADTDEFMVSDAGVLKRIDYSLIKSTPSATLLATATASSDSEIDFTSGIDSTYSRYRLDFNNIVPGSDGASLYMRFFQGGVVDTGSVYDYFYFRTKCSTTSTGAAQGQNQAQMILLDTVDSQTEGGIHGHINIYNPSNTNINTHFSHELVCQENGDISIGHFGHGRIEQTAAVDGVRIYFSSGNVYQGTIKLYGIT